MITILDASALINLINGDVLKVVLELAGMEFAIGPQVRKECPQQSDEIDECLRSALKVLADDGVPTSLFFSLLKEYQLGLGETESLALALKGGYSVCTDDRRARRMCAKALGSDRVFGTARLLQQGVIQGLMSPEEAICAYEKMRAEGAFLPDLSAVYFNPPS